MVHPSDRPSVRSPPLADDLPHVYAPLLIPSFHVSHSLLSSASLSAFLSNNYSSCQTCPRSRWRSDISWIFSFFRVPLSSPHPYLTLVLVPRSLLIKSRSRKLIIFSSLLYSCIRAIRHHDFRTIRVVRHPNMVWVSGNQGPSSCFSYFNSKSILKR